ncbi:MAG: YfhO family protein [Ruminococcus sp.]|nr:YfhO family protein [Ruminococcus sp.]
MEKNENAIDHEYGERKRYNSRTRSKRQKPKKPGRRFECFRRSKCYNILFEKGILYYLLSFLIPASIMTFAFAQNGIHPFGDRQMLVVDLWHQYYPFFRVVREKLLTGGSFLYSWENGLGTNFLSLISYYAASPLNWLSIFFDKDHVRDALTFILIAKIGFSGAFFSAFLSYTFKRRDFSLCVFSVMYALSSYTLGYYWNVMWFDTIALFPLVMLGIVAICREGKWKTYTFALALSLIANYYVGYFTCIFTIFMFMSAWITEFHGFRPWLKSLWLIFRSSVIAIGLGGFILLPAYYGLQLTYSVNNEFPKKTLWYEKWEDIFANTISYSEPTKVDGLPNFACGMLAILLIGVFLFSRGIKLREKISVTAMLWIIAVSCNMNKLNYIWHGFHFTNQIPYRFAFIFSFVLAAAAYRAYDIILRNGIKIYQLILMLMGPFTVFWLSHMSKGSDFSFTGAVRSSLIIVCAFWLVFIAAKIFPFKRQTARNRFLTLALAAAVFSEFVSNAQLGVKTVKSSSYNDYPSHSIEVQSLLSHISNTEDELFYRTEMTSTYTLNDSALYGFRGLSQFSSSANVSVTTFCKHLGLYASEAGNRYYYRTSTPVVNALFGIKYLIKRGDKLNSEAEVMDFEADAGTSYLYKNKYPLSLGYMVSDRILDLESSGGANPFEYQNDLIKLATDTEDPIFTAQAVTLVKYNNIEVTKNGYGNYTFRVPDTEIKHSSALYSFAGAENSILYGYANSPGGACDSLTISCGEDASSEPYKIVDSGSLIESYPIVFPMGNSGPGTTSKVEIFPKDGRTSGNYKLMVYALKKDNFKKAYDLLADEQLKVTKFEDTKIEGNIDVKKGGILFLSIPYEKGWKVYVDGEKAETMAVCGAMTGVRVKAGAHSIRLKYTPEGFPEGTAATAVSALLTGLIIWYEHKKKKLAAIEEAPSPEYSEEPPKETEAEPVQHTAAVFDQEHELKNILNEYPPEDDNEKPESNDSIQRH